MYLRKYRRTMYDHLNIMCVYTSNDFNCERVNV